LGICHYNANGTDDCSSHYEYSISEGGVE